jgi:hypothetical protein
MEWRGETVAGYSRHSLFTAKVSFSEALHADWRLFGARFGDKVVGRIRDIKQATKLILDRRRWAGVVHWAFGLVATAWQTQVWTECPQALRCTAF